MSQSSLNKIASELLRISAEVKVLDVPDTRQTFTYDCGAKAVQTILAYYGHDVREDNLIKFLSTTEKGTEIEDIIKVFKKYGLKVVEGQLTVEQLREAVDNGWPVLMPIQAWVEDLLQTNWEGDKDDGHYVIAIGYRGDEIVFEDPSAFEKQFLPEDELEERWHDYDTSGKKYDHYGIIVKGEPEYSSTKIKHME